MPNVSWGRDVPMRRVAALLLSFLATSTVAGVVMSGLFIPFAGASGSATSGSVNFFDSLEEELTRQPLSEQTKMLASDGKTVVARFYDENRVSVPLSKIAPVMREAIVAIEDSRFYEHGAIDPKGVLRAAIHNLGEGSGTQGASTLTQQYVKNILLERAVSRGDEAGATQAVEQTLPRKIKEMRYATYLEKHLTKDQILEGYLNISLFGDQVYGVEAAAQYFFSRHASELSLRQAAMLAGLVQQPTDFNPRNHPEAARTRRDVVLTRMRQLNLIEQPEYEKAIKSGLGLKLSHQRSGCANAGRYAFFCQFVIRSMQNDPAYSWLGRTPTERERAIRRGGLTIKTTINAKMQAVAAKQVVKSIPVKDKSGIGNAVVTVQPGTGKVLAMAENRVYDPQKGTTVNYATDCKVGECLGFQPGSTFKAIILAAWLKEGKSLYGSVDGPVQLKLHSGDLDSCKGRIGFRPDPWVVNNAGDGEGGHGFSIVEATAHSINTAYVNMLKQIDLCDVDKMAKDLGLHLGSPDASSGSSALASLTTVPSTVLGTQTIAPITMASAYATFASGGTYCEPNGVLEVHDRTGKKKKVADGDCRRALDEDVANAVTYALEAVIDHGTGAALKIGRPAAGKTGTTQNYWDTWFIGYTPQLATAAWVGDPGRKGTNKRRALKEIRIDGKYHGRVYGATIAGPLWQNTMKGIYDAVDLPKQDFSNPSGKLIHGSGTRVPDLTGHSISGALEELRGMGFDASVSGSQASSAPAGTVATTSPGPGSRVDDGGKVTIIVSSGGGDKPGGDQKAGNDQNRNGQNAGNNNGNRNRNNNRPRPPRNRHPNR